MRLKNVGSDLHLNQMSKSLRVKGVEGCGFLTYIGSKATPCRFWKSSERSALWKGIRVSLKIPDFVLPNFRIVVGYLSICFVQLVVTERGFSASCHVTLPTTSPLFWTWGPCRNYGFCYLSGCRTSPGFWRRMYGQSFRQRSHGKTLETIQQFYFNELKP